MVRGKIYIYIYIYTKYTKNGVQMGGYKLGAKFVDATAPNPMGLP